ncbi:hypothetical protein T06_9532 [Trichinella sp. T6]|nr:hypothetical protein T06_9532 [Trichinella sp. T6]
MYQFLFQPKCCRSAVNRCESGQHLRHMHTPNTMYDATFRNLPNICYCSLVIPNRLFNFIMPREKLLP